jgi:hypothetical protein
MVDLTLSNNEVHQMSENSSQHAFIVYPRCNQIPAIGEPIAIFGWLNLEADPVDDLELREFRRCFDGDIKISFNGRKIIFDRPAYITSPDDLTFELWRLEDTIRKRFGFTAVRIPFNPFRSPDRVTH